MAQKKAIFNNGQTGSLPSVSVVRNAAKDNIVDGGSYAINTPAYGHEAKRCKFNKWTEQDVGAYSWYAPVTGFDRNGTTKMGMAIQSTNLVLVIWRGTDMDRSVANGGSAVLDIDQTRISDNSVTVNGVGASDLFDVMHGAGDGDTLHPSQASVALRVRSGVCLPGCFLLLCEKQVDQGSDVWDTEGMSLVAIQSDGVGGFTRHWIGDHVGDTDPFASGRNRGREWAITTYFPFTLLQNPCLRAFIPYVDYIFNTPSSIGGQLGIIEATRTNINSPWVFGGLYHIYEKTETTVHFHSAAWTPRGVVLAQGDGTTLNENPIFSCSDWDDYDNASNWTHHTKNFGAGEYGSMPEHSRANQWAGSSPSRINQNKFFCGSDVAPHGLWSCEVLAGPLQRYVELWGYVPGDDLNDHLALEFSGPSKEIQRGMCCSIQSSLTPTPLRTKIIYGTENQGFACIARHPAGVNPGGYAKIYGDDVYVFNLGGSGPAIYKIAQPIIESIRGLAIGPGGTNYLEVESGSPDQYFSAVAMGGDVTATVSIITDDTGAPGSTPVYDIQADGTGSSAFQILRMSVSNGTYAFAGNCVYVAVWYRNMSTAQGIPLRLIYWNNGGSNTAYHIGAIYSGIEVGDWKLIIYTIPDGATPPTNPHDGSLRFETDANVEMPYHFRFQVQGVYNGTQCPYFLAPQATGANEQVTQNLTDVNDNWTVGIELHIPMGGEDFDYAAQSIKTTVALATLYVDSNNYIEITADIANEEVDFDVVVAGASIGVTTLSNFNLCRDTTIQLGITFDGTDFVFFGACGGLTETGLENGTITGDIGDPVSVRIGDNDFSEVPNTELNMVSLDDNNALSGDEFLNMMAFAIEGDSSKFGLRGALDWFEDQLVTSL